MTDEERVARLEGIIETWDRVLEHQRREFQRWREDHQREMQALRGDIHRVDEHLRDLGRQVAHLRGWIIGGVAVMAIITTIDRLLAL